MSSQPSLRNAEALKACKVFSKKKKKGKKNSVARAHAHCQTRVRILKCHNVFDAFEFDTAYLKGYSTESCKTAPHQISTGPLFIYCQLRSEFVRMLQQKSSTRGGIFI